jgi:hypothetical protein
LACPKRGGSHAEGGSGSIDDLPRSLLENSPAALLIGGAEPEPEGEMIFTRPAAHIQSDFADDCLPCHHIDSVYLGQIHATDSLQLVMQIKARNVAVFSPFPFFGQLVSGGVQMRAQMSGPPPSPPVGTKEDPAKAVDGLLSMMESQVVGAAKAMPADKYSFAPGKGIFAPGQTTQFDTVRTFVAQVTHLVQANYFFFGWSGIKPDRDLKAIGSITTKDEAVAALEASFVYAHRRLRPSRQKMHLSPSSRSTGSGRRLQLPLLQRPTGMITMVRWWSTYE